MKAETIARALGGRRAGGTWMARCPAHDDREPSLSITDGRNGKVLVRCHAGCDQDDVIAALRLRHVWNDGNSYFSRRRRSIGNHRIANKPDDDARKRTEAALALWRATQPGVGTLVERYYNHAASIMRHRLRFASIPD